MREKREGAILGSWLVLSWLIFGWRLGMEGLQGGGTSEDGQVNQVRWLLDGLQAMEGDARRGSAREASPHSSSGTQKRTTHAVQFRSHTQPQTPRAGQLDLNACDSASLEQLPKIGPVLAGRICRFREALGGFHSTEQLREVWGLKEEVAREVVPWFHVGEGVFRQICVDTASWAELRAHPYIGATGARAIERFRHHHPLKSVEALSNLVSVPDSAIRRWRPYLRICENTPAPNP